MRTLNATVKIHVCIALERNDQICDPGWLANRTVRANNFDILTLSQGDNVNDGKRRYARISRTCGDSHNTRHSPTLRRAAPVMVRYQISDSVDGGSKNEAQADCSIKAGGPLSIRSYLPAVDKRMRNPRGRMINKRARGRNA